MKNTPIDYDIVNETIDEMSIPDFGKATIREVVAIASRLEEKTGQEFIHMEMGVPGLPPAAVGVEAEIEALRNGVFDLSGYRRITSSEERSCTFCKSIYRC